MSQKKVVLIEDDAWLAELYRDILTGAGFAVFHAASAEAGLTLLDEQQEVACIVLDIFLPTHNGIEFLHEYASYADISATPVIILSSVLPEDIAMDQKRWQQYGVVEHLYKPTTKPAMLVQAVEQAIAQKAEAVA